MRRSTGWPSSPATRSGAPAATASPATRRSATGSGSSTRRCARTASRRTGSTTFPAARPAASTERISHPHDGSIQPARFVRRLAAAATAAGAEFREHDRVEDLAALDADRVLVATDGYGHGLVPELADLVWPTRGQMIVSEPLGRMLYDRPHYARQGFDYWQQLPDGRILLGGFRDVSILDELTDVEETTPAIQASLESFLHELVGEEVPVTHRWAGIFGLTQDMLPLVGPVPGRDGRVWVAGGYSGHGNVLGFACGELVADAILGRESPQLELLDPARFARGRAASCARLVEEHLDAAGQHHRRRDAEALLLRLAAELDPLLAELGHRPLEVVAHEADLMLSSSPRTDGRRARRAAA